jgi:hypothetical protein
MSHEAAERLLKLMLRHGAEQESVLLEVQSLCSEEEFRRYRRMIGRTMGCMLLEVINPIVEMYPDLRPPQLKQ